MATRTSKLNSDERTTLVTSTVTVRSPICENGTFFSGMVVQGVGAGGGEIV